MLLQRIGSSPQQSVDYQSTESLGWHVDPRENPRGIEASCNPSNGGDKAICGARQQVVCFEPRGSATFERFPAPLRLRNSGREFGRRSERAAPPSVLHDRESSSPTPVVAGRTASTPCVAGCPRGSYTLMGVAGCQRYERLRRDSRSEISSHGETRQWVT